ncbi:MAG: purine-nucleoside phosphorylase [Planctomycetota bacterium]
MNVSTQQKRINASVTAIKDTIGDFHPEVAIIFGTGLSSLASEIEDQKTLAYGDIPHFAQPTVESHAGELVFGKLAGKKIVAMRGRFHFYEGYSMEEITHPVRVMHALGAETLIVSNAAGGMNPRHDVGDICVLEDHINLLGGNPLIGANDERLGPRFPDMSAPYDAELMQLAEAGALAAGLKLHRAVYVAVTGPCLETRAEYRFLRGIGADLVGMSTVPEVIVANHESMRVLALSMITDACLPDALKATGLDEILTVAALAEPKMNEIVKRFLGALQN